ncbi:MAG: hypothetical protein JW804_04930 [Sedimentisphaerales bacterium]|nr:hypothetical protein [Sedimentisphaerales bacterium]
MEENKTVKITGGWGSLCLYAGCLAVIVFALILKSNDELTNSKLTADIVIGFCLITVLTSFVYSTTNWADKNRKTRPKKQRKDKKIVLKEIQEANNALRQEWRRQMLPHAEELAELFSSQNYPDSQKQAKAVDIGVIAWKQGGVECMNQLREMAIEIHGRKNGDTSFVDHIPYWWDGVGGWRNNSTAIIYIVKSNKKRRQACKV